MGSTSQVQIKQRNVMPPAARNEAVRDTKDQKRHGSSNDNSAALQSPAQDEYPEEILDATLELGVNEMAAAELDEVPEAETLGGDTEAVQNGEAGVPAEVAESFIASKRIGDRIKYLRQRKHMGLVELGRYTGLSASFLSQLETGRVVPTLRNLARLAMVFSKDLSYFFEPERPELFRVIRADERARLPQTGADEPGYFFESLGHVPMDQPITPYFAEFLPGNGRRAPRSHQHPGAEFLYMLTGQLQITHGGASTTMEGGDAVYFNSSSTHSYERMGDETCTALILTMPEPLRGTHTGAKIPAAAQGKAPQNGGRAR